MRPLPKYEYVSVDRSLLTPGFKKYIAGPCLRIIPYSLHPNLITIFSFFFTFIALTLSYLFPQQVWAHLLMGLLIFLYLLGDHLDGMQAKRRGGGTALGEYLDHFLDSITNGLLLVILANCFFVTDVRVLYIMFGCSYLMQASLFYEHAKSGIIYFGPFGAFEIVLCGVFTISLGAFSPIYDVLSQIVISDLRVVDILFSVVSLSGLSILFNIYYRLGKKSLEIIILQMTILVSSVMTLVLGIKYPLYLIIGFSTTLLIQEYILSRLTGIRRLWIDIIPLVLFVIMVLVRVDISLFLGIIAAIIVVRFIISVKVLNPLNFKE